RIFGWALRVLGGPGVAETFKPRKRSCEATSWFLPTSRSPRRATAHPGGVSGGASKRKSTALIGHRFTANLWMLAARCARSLNRVGRCHDLGQRELENGRTRILRAEQTRTRRHGRPHHQRQRKRRRKRHIGTRAARCAGLPETAIAR